MQANKIHPTFLKIVSLSLLLILGACSFGADVTVKDKPSEKKNPNLQPAPNSNPWKR